MKASIVQWVVSYPVVLHRGEEFGVRMCGRTKLFNSQEEAESFILEYIDWSFDRTLQRVYTDSRGYKYYYYTQEGLEEGVEIKLYPIDISIDIQIDSSRIYYPNVSEIK